LVASVLFATPFDEAPAQGSGAATSYTEYQVKAAFLYNFARFVDWPADAFRESESPFRIGIFGENSFGTTLEQLVAGKNVKGRPLTVVRFERVQDIEDCQILFVGAGQVGRISQVLAKVGTSAILTVGEVDGLARRGGIINFVLRENRVRFQVNVDAAERAHLRISSKLLKLAEIVRDSAPDPAQESPPGRPAPGAAN